MRCCSKRFVFKEGALPLLFYKCTRRFGGIFLGDPMQTALGEH
jgi:hypothetical protein